MTKDDIIRMAREAGLQTVIAKDEQALERFSALVAAAERQACANLCKMIADNATDPHASYCAAAITNKSPLVVPRGSLGEEV